MPHLTDTQIVELAAEIEYFYWFLDDGIDADAPLETIENQRKALDDAARTAQRATSTLTRSISLPYMVVQFDRPEIERLVRNFLAGVQMRATI